MKPMTIQQAAIYQKYRIDLGARNKYNLKVWRPLYIHTQSILEALKDNLRGATPDADT
jgi:hypothetical protein